MFHRSPKPPVTRRNGNEGKYESENKRESESVKETEEAEEAFTSSSSSRL